MPKPSKRIRTGSSSAPAKPATSATAKPRRPHHRSERTDCRHDPRQQHDQLRENRNRPRQPVHRLQLKQSIGTGDRRLVTDLITTPTSKRTRAQNHKHRPRTENSTSTPRDIEQAITISEISGTKYITGMTAAGTVMSVSKSQTASTKKYPTTTQREHLGHLTSDDDGITSITTGDGTNLDTEDARQRWIPDQRRQRHNGIHYGRRRNRRQPLPHPQHAATQQRHMRQHRARDDMLGIEIGRTPPRSRLRPFGSNRRQNHHNR